MRFTRFSRLSFLTQPKKKKYETKNLLILIKIPSKRNEQNNLQNHENSIPFELFRLNFIVIRLSQSLNP